MKIGIPKTTLQRWQARKDSMDVSPAAAEFFESPAGLSFLHQFLVAMHLVMVWKGTCGIRLVCLLIELSGLGPFVAASYGAQQGMSSEMQEALVQYGREQRALLAKDMPRKDITICEDETFLSEDICLVAMEPVSGFILHEDYASQRDTTTWNEALEKAKGGLNVTVIQSTADEGQAIGRHAKDQEASHSPDLFHVQNEGNRAMVLPLLRKETLAAEARRKAREETVREEEAQRSYWAEPRGRGRPPAFDKRIGEARAVEEEAASSLEQAREHRVRSRTAIRGIEEAYHPYDLDSGAPRPAEVVAGDLERRFEELFHIAHEAELPERSLARLEKAKRVLPKMVATISFFHGEVTQRVEALGLPLDQERLLVNNLIPSAYLQRVATKTADTDKKARLRRTQDAMLSELLFTGGPASAWSADDQTRLENIAFECADIFQRSSSCLEGRNGRLSQWEHALRHLYPKKLEGLTVIHNFLNKRPDGTTAAERFFGRPPQDLFLFLMARLPIPARPAERREHQKNPGLFQRLVSAIWPER
jgi:hypothetical protein